jgi:galactokinase
MTFTAATIREHFQQTFDGDPDVIVRAPGRVNLIGEHTDYNEGFVLPAAIDRYVWYAGRRRADRKVCAQSLNFQELVEFDLDDVRRDDVHPWSNYLRGVSKFIQTDSVRLPGADLLLGGDVPREAGLSSSAAIEVGAAVFWQRLANLSSDSVSIARLAQKAENEFVGVPCGIMDQFASALSRQDHALFLDCRDLAYRHVPLDSGVHIVVCNSGIRRALAQSEYQTRRTQCAEAVARLRRAALPVSSLRDLDAEDLETARRVLTEVLFNRVRHVVTENARVLTAVRALEAGDIEEFGKLMNQSHASLRDDYEVSCRELDLLVELALAQRGVLGARMTGAGFGGCTVNLVRQEFTDAFAEGVGTGYAREQGRKAEVYVFRASDGALAGSG